MMGHLPKLVWILGVGIPAYFLIYLGIFNLGIPLPDYTYGIELSFETSILAIGLGAVASYGLFFHYTMRSMGHGKHCEKTSFVEFFLVIAFVVFVINVVFNLALQPFGHSMEWIVIFGLASLAGGIGVILYRLERNKKLIPF